MATKSYLVFSEQPSPGKTKRFIVRNNSGEQLGWIHWRNGWRKYVYGTSVVGEYDTNCLKEITSFIDKLMEERK